MVNYYSVHI